MKRSDIVEFEIDGKHGLGIYWANTGTESFIFTARGAVIVGNEFVKLASEDKRVKFLDLCQTLNS